MRRLKHLFEMLFRNQLLAWLGVLPVIIYLSFAVFGREFAQVFLFIGPIFVFYLGDFVAIGLAKYLNRYVFKSDVRWENRMRTGLWLFLCITFFPLFFRLLNTYLGTEVELHAFGDYVLFATIAGFAGFYLSSGKAKD